MFRVVTTVQPPMFFLLCDNRICAAAATAELDPTAILDDQSRNTSAHTFLAGRGMEGWQVGLTGQFCPECVKKDLAAMNKTRVVEPTGQDIRQLKVVNGK